MEEQNPQPTLPPQQSPIPPQNVNPIPQPQQYYYGKRNWIKWILIYLIIAALIYGGIYYLATQQKKSSPYSTNYPSPTISQPSTAPDEIANWKTYKTDNYQISYPQDLYKISDIGSSPSSTFTYFISINDTNQENSLQDVLPFTISVSKTDKNMPVNNPKDLFGNYGSTTYDAGYFLKDKTPQPYLLGGVSGYVIYDIGAGVSGIEREIIVINNNNLYDIQTEYSSPKDIEKYKKLVGQILSTFRFLDQTQATPTGNPEGKFCGGIAGNLPEFQCPTGYKCHLDGNYPDASGKCVKQ